MYYVAHPSRVLFGEQKIPGDKSISHRAVILASISQGTSRLRGFLEAEDTLKTIHAMQALGVSITGPVSGVLTVNGVGLRGLMSSHKPLEMGNSGTSMRLLMGLLAAQSFDSVLVGDQSLSRRPMERVAIPLRAMGANITTTQGYPPIRIRGTTALRGITYTLPIASAQVKSALLLAGLYADGEMQVREPIQSRDHTERLLNLFTNKEGVLTATNLTIPGDFSSAAFFMVGALIAENSSIMLTNVGVNPTRLGALHILRKMGGNIEFKNIRHDTNEPMADIIVQSSNLKGIEIPSAWVPGAMDEFPILMIAAACSEGKTILRGAGELRLKESDRIKTIVEGLTQLGIRVQELEDGLVVEGGKFHGGTIQSYGDHRIAMAFAIAALRASEPIVIEDCQNVHTSFPQFIETAHAFGLQIHERV